MAGRKQALEEGAALEWLSANTRLMRTLLCICMKSRANMSTFSERREEARQNTANRNKQPPRT
jgi:hypothetical protein